MRRELRWNGNEFVHTDCNGEDVCDGPECVTLVDDYPGLSCNSCTWQREVWERLAEHILWERDRGSGTISEHHLGRLLRYTPTDRATDEEIGFAARGALSVAGFKIVRVDE